MRQRVAVGGVEGEKWKERERERGEGEDDINCVTI